MSPISEWSHQFSFYVKLPINFSVKFKGRWTLSGGLPADNIKINPQSAPIFFSSDFSSGEKTPLSLSFCVLTSNRFYFDIVQKSCLVFHTVCVDGNCNCVPAGGASGTSTTQGFTNRLRPTQGHFNPMDISRATLAFGPRMTGKVKDAAANQGSWFD